MRHILWESLQIAAVIRVSGGGGGGGPHLVPAAVFVHDGRGWPAGLLLLFAFGEAAVVTAVFRPQQRQTQPWLPSKLFMPTPARLLLLFMIGATLFVYAAPARLLYPLGWGGGGSGVSSALVAFETLRPDAVIIGAAAPRAEDREFVGPREDNDKAVLGRHILHHQLLVQNETLTSLSVASF